MNESALILSAFENGLRTGLVYKHSMRTNPAVEQNKTLNGPRVCGISPVGKEKDYGGKYLPKSQVLSSNALKVQFSRSYQGRVFTGQMTQPTASKH